MPDGMAILCAPYAPPERSRNCHLGASSKIASVARILAKLYQRVTLINSAHNEEGAWSSTTANVHDGLGTRLREVHPPLVPWQNVGKALNLLHDRPCLGRIGPGRVDCIWVYNAYAFDGRMALLLKRRWPEARLVVEIEDWPYARKRHGLGRLKDRLDALALDGCLAVADLVTTVNAAMAGFPALAGRRVIPLPCILNPALVAAAAAAPVQRTAIGYFGGMHAEKGFAVLLDALGLALAQEPSLPAGFILCGAGPLIAQARSLAARHPQIRVFSGVDQRTLYGLMTSCAMVVNPHRHLPGSGDRGIFPFKIIEGIAAGALVASAPFEDPGLDISASIRPFDGSATALARILLEPPGDAMTTARRTLQRAVLERFNEASIAGMLGAALVRASA